MLASRNLGAKTLCIYESLNTYYTFCADDLAADVADLADDMNVNDVIIVGSSKSGYGAILLGRLFEHRRIRLRSVAFSPVTRVYPLDKPLPFRTYQTFVRMAESKENVRASALSYGHLPPSPRSPTYQEHVIYGKNCSHDKIEVEHLLSWSENASRFLRISTVETSTHNVISLFSARRESVAQFHKSILKNSRDDELPWHEVDEKALIAESETLFRHLDGWTLEQVLGLQRRPWHKKAIAKVASTLRLRSGWKPS